MQAFTWAHEFEARSDLSPAELWVVLADVARWPEIDTNIGRLELAGPPRAGSRFMLQPKGGPRLQFTIGEFAAPHRYADICRLLGARMTTLHQLQPQERGGTRILIQIRIEGPMAWFWGPVVGRRHAAGLPAQTSRFVAAAGAARTAAT